MAGTTPLHHRRRRFQVVIMVLRVGLAQALLPLGVFLGPPPPPGALRVLLPGALRALRLGVLVGTPG